MRVIGYRIDHGLSQTGLAGLLGMHQPAIAWLEAGDHEPSLATLSGPARVLGIEFHIDTTPDAFGLRETAWPTDREAIRAPPRRLGHDHAPAGPVT
jgi:transcriptional regulator with XRE-family HTH domain